MTTIKGRVVGYARTSGTEQKLDLQLDALRLIGADPIFTDQLSGATTKRPGLDQALALLEPGDQLAVWKLDRLGRSLHHLVSTVNALRERDVGFRSLTESIDTGTPHGRLLFGLFGTLAEFERALITERVAAGRQSARDRGQRFGAPLKLSPSQIRIARQEIASGRRPVDVAQDLHVSRATLYAAFAREDEQSAVVTESDWKPRGRGRPKRQNADLLR